MTKQKNGTEHIWFLRIAIITGLLLALITPPMCTPDENAHYMNAYSISRGDFYPEVVNGQIGRYVSTRVLQFKDKYTGKYDGKFGDNYSFGEAYFDSWLPNDDYSESFYASTLTSIPPTGFFASGLGMAVGAKVGDLFERTENELPYNLMLYGRFGNLAYYIVILFIAIKISPRFRKTMLVIATMPMSLFLGASLNYDAVLIPTAILLVAVILRLVSAEYEKVRWTDVAMVAWCVFILVGVKLAYAPLLLLLLAVPKEKYGGKKQLCFCIGVVITTAIVAYIPYIIDNSISSQAINQYEELWAEQSNYIRNNWTKLPAIFLNSFKVYKGFYLQGFWGKLGQIDTNFPVPLMVCFYVALLVISLSECCDSNVWQGGPWKRLLPLCGTFISLVGMFFKMYSTWTPRVLAVGAEYVSGIQGRYFIPLFLPVVLCLANGLLGRFKFRDSVDEMTECLSKWCSLICGVLTVGIVYMRYW